MKLLFVSNLFPDQDEPIRGLDNANLLHYLKPHFEKVSALGLRPSLPFSKKRWLPRPEDADLNPSFVPAPYIPKIGSRWNHKLMAHALAAPLETLDYDHILVSWLYPDGCAIAETAKVPFTMICQGSDAHAYLRNPVRRNLIIQAIGKSKGVITRSADLARRLNEAGAAAEKLHPIYNGVDTALFHPSGSADPVLDKDSRWLLFVGNFLPVKNPLLLIKAWAIVRKNLPRQDIRLAMIGSGPLEGDIRSAAADAGLGNFLEIAGRQAPDKVAAYMRAADLLCMSSHNEGVPNVVLEALSSGLPVISTNVGGISEVLDRPLLGELVSPNDPQALATAITKSLSNPADRFEIAKHAQRFSWQQTAQDYYDNIAN